MRSLIRTARGTLTIALGAAIIILLAHPGGARPPQHPLLQQGSESDPAASAEAAESSVLLAYYDFEGPAGADAQGWTSVDRTAQTGIYWHVDTFRVPTGGGSHAMWCGAQPDATAPLCAYACLPGYGNRWSQILEMPAPMAVEGDATLSFSANWDTETDYDYVYVEYLDKDSNWNQVASLDGLAADTSLSCVAPAANLNGTVRFRLRFESDGTYSDEDCEIDTNGAIQVDDLTVADTTGVLHTEDFEGEAVGAQVTDDGVWAATAVAGKGDYAGLFDASDLYLPTSANDTHVWGFTRNSPFTCYNSYNCYVACGPDTLHVVPGRSWGYGEIGLADEIWSPPIDWTTGIDNNPVDPAATQTLLQFKVYRNLTLEGAVFYIWRVRSSATDVTCASWPNNPVPAYFGYQGDWYTFSVDITPYIDPGATEIQVALGAYDLSNQVCFGIPECGDCLTQSPLFDDVRVIRHTPSTTAVAPAYANALEANVPNPFNPATTIRYTIAQPAHVSLRIYDVHGRLVRTLVDRELTPAAVTPVEWRGDDDAGRPVASGVYFCQLNAGSFEASRKMVLLK